MSFDPMLIPWPPPSPSGASLHPDAGPRTADTGLPRTSHSNVNGTSTRMITIWHNLSILKKPYERYEVRGCRIFNIDRESDAEWQKPHKQETALLT